MPFFSCDATDCKEPGVRGECVCFSCGRHLCATHMLDSKHSCEEDQSQGGYARCFKREMKSLPSRVNIDALRARATSLRGGISCRISLTKDIVASMMGGMNYNIPIVFEDGVNWICRIRRNNVSTPPVEVQNHIISSEAATLRFLASTSIPVPKVHDFAVISPDNPIGVGYILMDKLDGKPIYDWLQIPTVQKRHVLKQLVDIFAELEKYPFSTIGSLQDPHSSLIGPIAAEYLADVDSENRLDVLGPFSNAVEYRLATVQRKMELIARGEVHHTNGVDSYLVHRGLLDRVSAFAHIEQSTTPLYYLKHMDDKGDHILLDDDFNIKGIIDWEGAQIVPKSEAFAAPLFLLDVGRYYNGENALSEHERIFASMLEEQGHGDLADSVRNGRREHRWASCLGGDAGDSSSLQAVFLGLRAALGEDKQSWDAWRNHALDTYRDDEGLKALLKRNLVAQQDVYNSKQQVNGEHTVE